ncbi:hypothetical protein HAZT_HAZT006238 [Hyalella azteca]|uniref:Uncharacterized protein LOC108677066 n=1 Tax=Hyalella azteca TaxID=294128 RepID=A0A6A0GTH5_HYAAZ|nr:uncharacterized protein LOC108677066 [Hyalella azteca]KAA0186949.1 hypothetical protein HAZT_HAZT006238 [Hyalella azteca]
MSSSDVAAVVGAVTWRDDGSYVKEVVNRGHLPQLAKVIKGQYLSVGVPSLANPSLSSTLLLSSAGKNVRVAAQSVKFKEGRRVVPVGPKLAIPDTFDGYFEILSEDGRAVKCIESVAELAKRFPDSCLVRETVKAYVSRSDDVDFITEKSRSVQAGETLVLVGDVVNTKSGKPQLKYLRCFDEAGQNIYLPYDAKGKFSAIAKEDNISGVHSIRNLLNKRLPLMVRLINGRLPLGIKTASQFHPELRLFGTFTEEALAALPLGKDAPMTILPPSAPLKLTQVKNAEQVEKTKEFYRICEKANNLLQEISDRILVYDVSMRGGKYNSGSRDPRFCNADIVKPRKYLHCNSSRALRSKSTPATPVQLKAFHENKSDDIKMNGALPKDDYDEIDQIYDYVRGFAPLPKHIRSPFANKDDPQLKRSVLTEARPAPPPIETIPSRRDFRSSEKLSPSIHPALISAALEKAERRVEKRTRKSDEKNNIVSHLQHHPLQHQMTPSISVPSNKNCSKLFIKASQQKSNKSHMFRQKSCSPVKESLCDGMPPTVSTSPSSLFKLRYKSLTNLAMDLDTLDSSTSCGKNSADSSGSAAMKARLPEKKCRRLTRPTSLTNLVWDSRCSPVCHNPPDVVDGGAARAIVEIERRLRLEPGVYRHGRDAPALIAATTRLLASHNKIGTLYL